MMPLLTVFVALIASVGGFLPVAVESAALANGKAVALCAKDEVVLASCSVRSKIASVCGHNHRAIYRFGRVGRIELSADDMYHAHQLFSGGGESQIVVNAGPYQYVLYDRTVRTGFGRDDRNDPAFFSGLSVLRNGSHLANLVCTSRSEGMIDTASTHRFMPAGVPVTAPHIGK